MIYLALLLAYTHGIQDLSSNMTTRDQEVYAVVLDSLFARPNIGRLTQIVVRDSTLTHTQEKLVAFVIQGFKNFPGTDNGTISNFLQRNTNSIVPSVGQLASGVPVVVATRSKLDSLPRGLESYWHGFYQAYPKSAGLISLWAIGYNASGDVAILMLDQGCGSLCGNGYAVSLKRKSGKWVITRIQRTWLS